MSAGWQASVKKVFTLVWLPPSLRQQVAAAPSSQSRAMVSVDGGFLTIRLDQPRRERAAALRVLRRARQLVTTDAE